LYLCQVISLDDDGSWRFCPHSEVSAVACSGVDGWRVVPPDGVDGWRVVSPDGVDGWRVVSPDGVDGWRVVPPDGVDVSDLDISALRSITSVLASGSH